jgi:ubiquitin-conjugating enzyme E2 J1
MTARREAAQGVGALDVSQTERERMARSSVGWTCAACARRNDEILPPAPLGERRGAEQLPHGLEVADASTPAEGPTPVSQATDKALAQAAAPEAALLATPQPTVEEPPAANLAALAASGASAASAEAKAPPTEQVPPRVPVAPAPSASTEAATSAPLGVADAATSRASGSSAPRERSTPSWLPAHAPPPPPPSSAASRAPAAQPAIRLPHAAATLRPQRPALGPRVSTGTLRPAAAAAATHAAQAAARPAAEQRVAQLDRAIATVVLLLACMLVRRWLQ